MTLILLFRSIVTGHLESVPIEDERRKDALIMAFTPYMRNARYKLFTCDGDGL